MQSVCGNRMRDLFGKVHNPFTEASLTDSINNLVRRGRSNCIDIFIGRFIHRAESICLANKNLFLSPLNKQKKCVLTGFQDWIGTFLYLSSRAWFKIRMEFRQFVFRRQRFMVFFCLFVFVLFQPQTFFWNSFQNTHHFTCLHSQRNFIFIVCWISPKAANIYDFTLRQTLFFFFSWWKNMAEEWKDTHSNNGHRFLIHAKKILFWFETRPSCASIDQFFDTPKQPKFNVNRYNQQICRIQKHVSISKLLKEIPFWCASSKFAIRVFIETDISSKYIFIVRFHGQPSIDWMANENLIEMNLGDVHLLLTDKKNWRSSLLNTLAFNVWTKWSRWMFSRKRDNEQCFVLTPV